MTDAELLEVLREDVVQAARALLGATLIRNGMSARIVETEAYRAADDGASHAFRGLTPRNAPMFGPPGCAYVYFTYGNHWMLNVTALEEGAAAAVLIRAAEPLEGLAQMRANRPDRADRDLLSGPGKLCQALAIDSRQNGAQLMTFTSDLQLKAPHCVPQSILVGPRIGIRNAVDFPWRFIDAGHAEWASSPRIR